MPMLTNFQAVEKGLTVAKNINLANRCGASSQDIIQFIGSKNMKNFQTDLAQMPFITVARRISNAVTVKKVIVEELSKETSVSSNLGIRVLMNTIESTPYQVSNIEDYLYPTDTFS